MIGRMDLDLAIAQFDPSLPIERASMPPGSWYTEPDFYRLEQRAVLWRSWQPVCRVAEVADPGDRMAGCFAGLPWVVARTSDGELVAYENVCRHKGAEVLKRGPSHGDAMVCQYHGWTYDLTGRLRKAPKIAGIQDFDREAFGLRPLATEVWGHWVFINEDLTAPPLSSRLTPLTDMLDATAWTDLTWVDGASWVLECNWKVYVDNYLDGGYHIPILHPTLDSQLDMASYRTDLYDTFNVQTSPASDAPQGGRIGPGAVYAWMHPNFMLNRYGTCLDTNWVIPLGPDRCRVQYDFFFEETESSEAKALIAQSIEQSAITQREDIYISECVQNGLASGRYTPGRYAPRQEMGEYQFHRLLAAALRDAIPAQRLQRS